ncbi:unnamed protein product [Rotaria sp. Silwood2]|nr:unnamed protein product [Rotaria sp. Silwood2]
MDVHSTHCSPKSTTRDNTAITDANIQEIENIFLNVTRTPTEYELRLKKACQQLLQHPCSVISTLSLVKKIDRDAANCLVDDCLLLFTDNLFEAHSQLDPEGYIKYIPNSIDLTFINRLLHYKVDPTLYFQDINIPELWKSYLSINGTLILRTMDFYRKILDSTASNESSVNLQYKNLKNNDQNGNLSLTLHAQSFDEQSPNMNRFDQKQQSSIAPSSCSVERVSFARMISSIDECNTDIRDKTPSKKPLDPQKNNDYLLIQSDSTNFSTNKPTMNWNLLRKRIIGLKNIDNKMCYINAALQCFANTPPLIEWLFDRFNELNTCELSKQNKFCSICELTKIIASIYPSSTKKSVQSDIFIIPSADCIRTHIHLISPVFTIGHQEDVSEFIISFLQNMSCCLPSHLSISSISSTETTIVDQIFNIKLLSSGECSSCLYTFKKEEITNMLLIEIDNMHHLTDAPVHFVGQEAVRSFFCSNCHKSVILNKRITISELSPILIINFKRCKMAFDSTEKLLHQVNYNEFLDVSPYMTSHLSNSNDKENKNAPNNVLYKLYAVINHGGDDLGSGHYYSYIRSRDDLWFLVDDAHFRNVPSNEVFNHSDTLILFYAHTLNISTIRDTSLQIPQPLMSSILANSTSICESTICFNEQLPKNKSLFNMMSTTSPDNISSKNITESNLENTHSIISSRKSIIVNNGPFAGQTESTIIIGNQNSNHQIEKKIKTDHISNNHTKCRSMFSEKLSSLKRKTTDDSIDEISDGEEKRKKACKTLASVASGVPIDEIFEDTLPYKHKFYLNETELAKMNQFRQQEIKKELDRKMQSLGLASDPSLLRKNTSKIENWSTFINNINVNESYITEKKIETYKKVNIEYLNLLLPHLKHYNAACGLCIRSRYFGKNATRGTSLLVRCILKCNGSICKFKCTVHIMNNGNCFITAINRKISHHIREKIGRPIRGCRRQAIIEKFKAGASVYRLHAQYDKERTKNERKGFNYDRTGKSRKIFKKIKAEATAESLLAPNVTSGILQLHDQLLDQINNDGIIKGAIQLVQLRPFCIVAFTEASLRLYDVIVSKPDTVLSWDATGGVIKNTTSRQCLYYELTVSHPNIVFPHKKDSFPRPAMILSDRAQIFLQAGLYIFNEENYQQFLARAYRIVTNQPIKNDLWKTNIHACLSHFMLDMRKRINKYLPEGIRELGMWCIALLVNTNMWVDMKENWRLICEVFLNYSTNETVHYKQHYSVLLSRISKITNDPNSSAAINQSRKILSESVDPFQFDDDNENFNLEHNSMDSNETIQKKKKLNKLHARRSSADKSIIDEEKLLNEFDSNFKNDLHKIYNECYENHVKSAASNSSLDKPAKSIRQWLTYFNQNCIPTVAIWSNLLMGNLSRHITSSAQAFDNLLLNTHDQRTNAISERRMCIVKRTQLGTQTYMRSDVVLLILIQDMLRMTENFAISYMATTTEDTYNEVHQQKLKELQENWRKKNRRGSGFYTKKPETSIMNGLKYTLIASSTKVNDGLSIPNLHVPNWLNVVIGVLISIKSIRESLPLSLTISTPFLNDILCFIDKWVTSLNSNKLRKQIIVEQMHISNTKFQIPTDVPIDVNDQLNFILHQILLRIIDCSIPAIKIYSCISCKFTLRTRFNINYIPINMIEGQFQLRHQLHNYFNSCLSDHLCSKCSMSMSRQIKLLECPSVIILSIDHVNISPTILRKPPSSIFFQSFLEDFNIGCSSSSIYDIVGFVSILPNAEKRLILATKIKERWSITSMKKLIGTGEKLSKLFAHSRLIILERVRMCDSNFTYAIAQCCSYIFNDIEENDLKICKTLSDAVKMIENKPTLSHLCSLLSSHYTTHYQCLYCQCTPSSLSITNKCISIFHKNTEHSSVYASPLTLTNMTELYCSVCNKKSENVILPIKNQVHHQYPLILMYYSTQTTLHAVSDLHIEFIDDSSQCKYTYRPSSVLLIDEYNALSVVQLENLLVFCKSPYKTATKLPTDRINELFYTAKKIVIFLKQSTKTTISTPFLLKSPLPVQLVNKSTGVSKDSLNL